MTTARGKFITFEGPEGSGKTTQAKRLLAQLEAAGMKALYTREPGGTGTGEAIRGILQHNQAGEPVSPPAEVLLFAASRAQLVQRVILPALEAGQWVVCDRFADSTAAYQGFGRQFELEDILAINRFAIHGAIPDVTFLLDVDLNTGFARLDKRNAQQGVSRDRIENEARTFHERVRHGYLELARREPKRFSIMDANQTPDTVAAAIWQQLQIWLP